MRVTVSVPDEVGRRAEAAAAGRRISVSAFYAEAVDAHLKELSRREIAAALDALVDVMEPAEDAVEELHRLRREDDRA